MVLGCRSLAAYLVSGGWYAGRNIDSDATRHLPQAAFVFRQGRVDAYGDLENQS